MSGTMKRWDKESKEFLEQLGGHESSPLEEDVQKEKDVAYRRYHPVGGQRKKGQPGDPAVVLSIRVRQSRKEAIRELSERTKTLMTDLIDEALEDLLKKYESAGGSCQEKD